MAVLGSVPAPPPPGRLLPRLAAVLTQLSCGACLLIGTIGLVLVQQNKVGSLAAVAVWLVMAMAGLVFGGLVYRGGLVNQLIAAAVDVGFGIALLVLDAATLHALLKILPASDVESIVGALRVAGGAMIGAGALCLAALPQGVRYASWFRVAAATRTAMSTARGFPPPPVPARGSAYIIPAEQPSRRRLYIVLGGLAIGSGMGIGVLVSSPRPAKSGGVAVAPVKAPVQEGSAAGAGPGPAVVTPVAARTPGDAGVEIAAADAREAAAGGGEAGGGAAGGEAASEPEGGVKRMLAAQHAAIAKADRAALVSFFIPAAFGFGTNADEVADGRDAVVSQILHDLGELPMGGFTVEAAALSIGEERGHAWIAEELDIGGAGREPRRFSITELAAVIDGHWRIVALHWATPVDDATAERLAILNRLVAPQPIPDRDAGSELGRAVRAAFASRAAFADARSERADAFNLGSGGERAHGGVAIKRIFSKLKAQVRQHDGVRVVAGSAWDASQQASPWIGWAALNVDFTMKSRAQTDITQTFRVLAILIKEGSDWKIVQTQWSNGGPLAR